MPTKKSWIAIAILVVLASPMLEAQWVMVARAASKRVRTMKQTDENGNGYDIATVLLEAPVEKVFETAILDFDLRDLLF